MSQNADTPDVGKAVEQTRAIFKAYGIDFLAHGMDDPGWKSPAYRLKDPRFSSYSDFRLTLEERGALSAAYEALPPDLKQLDLNWISDRLVRRYQVSPEAAWLGLVAYMVLWDTWGQTGEGYPALPALVDWAFFEHVLWTERYRDNSMQLYGRSLERGDYQWDRRLLDSDDKTRVNQLLENAGLGLFTQAIGKAGWVAV